MTWVEEGFFGWEKWRLEHKSMVQTVVTREAGAVFDALAVKCTRMRCEGKFLFVVMELPV